MSTGLNLNRFLPFIWIIIANERHTGAEWLIEHWLPTQPFFSTQFYLLCMQVMCDVNKLDTLTNFFHRFQIVIVLSEAWEVKFSFVIS